MITYAIMALIVLFLAFELLYKAEYRPDDTHLFNKQNSNAMRGFWCLIVIFVHIPAAYQNRIQDMIGSFAYIGVTFFFMTSAYGLKLGIEKDPVSIRYFWRKRFPRLLIPMFLVNIVSMIFRAIEGNELSFSTLININGWVQWLLVCYLMFWAANRIVSCYHRSPGYSRGGVSGHYCLCADYSVQCHTLRIKKSHFWNYMVPGGIRFCVGNSFLPYKEAVC